MPPAAPPSRRTLVIGGARSGKSGHAEALAAADGNAVRYIATARRRHDDTDFEQRIAAHRDRRPANWTVVESSETSLPELLNEQCATTLVDDIGTWLTVVIDDAGAWERPRGTVAAHTDALVSAVADHSGRLVLVSPEVGQGVIPASASGRLFRDELGELNQRLAAVSDEVLFVVAGLPIRLK